MDEESLEFQLSAEELTLLRQAVFDHQSLADFLAPSQIVPGRKLIVRLDRAQAEKLRDCLTEQLARVGFDENYSLTKTGQMIEDLIDRFYVP